MKLIAVIALASMMVICSAQSRVTTPCQTEEAHKYNFCDTGIPVHQRIQDLMSQIPETEKLRLFGTTSHSIPRYFPRKHLLV